MKIFPIALAFFIAIAGSSFVAAQTPTAETQQPEVKAKEEESKDETKEEPKDKTQDDKKVEKKIENKFFDRLKERKTYLENMLAKEVKKKELPEDVLDFTRELIKQIQYQMDIVETKIANGETFGSKEYQEVEELLKKQSADSVKRSRQDNAEQYETQMKKTQLEYERKIAEANRKSQEARKKSQKKYQASIAAAELLYKFRTNQNKIGMVIWNLPVDRKLHKRFTRTVNIRLLKGDQVVWSQKNYKLSSKTASTAIKIPNVIFNKVVVDVVKWKGVGGGLAEIEVYVGKENVAANRPCEVTNSETLPTHLDDQHSFTDGTTQPTVEGEGYWIPEEKLKASVTIDLLGMIEDDE